MSDPSFARSCSLPLFGGLLLLISERSDATVFVVAREMLFLVTLVDSIIYPKGSVQLAMQRVTMVPNKLCKFVIITSKSLQLKVEG